MDVNTAPYEMILRIPGIGTRSAAQIVASRRYCKLNSYHLKKIGVVMKKAQYFIVNKELPMHTINELKPETVKRLLTTNLRKDKMEGQLSFNFEA
jgi:predicted DNA-binding helix-hairpin-helix protein